MDVKPNPEIPSGIALSDEIIYQESFAMLRTFAGMSTTVRNAMIVQGFVALSASGLLTSQEEYFLATFSSIFCLLLTGVLFIMHTHYNAYYQSVRDFIHYQETINLPPGAIGYVKYVEAKRNERVLGRRLGWMRNYGPFLLVAMSAATLFVIVVFLWITHVPPAAPTLFVPI